MTVLWTTLLVLFFLLAVAVHEMAHGFALRNLGFRVVEAGIGFPFPPRVILPSSRYVPFRLSLSLWLLGAYVAPDPDQQEEIDALPYRDAAWYFGAGVIANLLLGGALWFILAVVEGHWSRAVITSITTAVLWYGRRLITAYVFPVVGVPVLLGFGYLLTTTVGQPQGPVGVGAALVASEWHTALVIAFALTTSLGILNLLPIYPLDGGRIMSVAIARLYGGRLAAWFCGVTGALTACLLVYAVVSDFVWLAR